MEETERVEFCTQHDCGVTVKKMSYLWQGRLDYAQLITLLWLTSYIKWQGMEWRHVTHT